MGAGDPVYTRSERQARNDESVPGFEIAHVCPQSGAAAGIRIGCVPQTKLGERVHRASSNVLIMSRNHITRRYIIIASNINATRGISAPKTGAIP